MPAQSQNIFLKLNIFRPELAWQILSQIYFKFENIESGHAVTIIFDSCLRFFEEIVQFWSL